MGAFFLALAAIVFFTMILVSSSMRIVREDTRLSVYRFGKYIGEKGPGIVIVIPIIDKAEVKQLGGLEKTPSTRMAGVIGETHTTVYTGGKVVLSGEEWDAMSHRPISAGQRVRVVRMILEVEQE
jgi:membrane-bound ClpP family serine protease